MVVGYSLGNRNDLENDILVLGEDDPDVITYSRCYPIAVSRLCRNNCPYCSFSGKDGLTVPYSTIKNSKAARENGVREVLFMAGERPDKFPHVRSMLDLWGFGSFLDYMYTICELGFLEGLIPVMEIGFLVPEEMKKLAEVCAGTKIMLDSVDNRSFEKLYSESPGKKLDIRLKSLEWAGRLKLPTTTGIMVGIGETQEHRKSMFRRISEVHQEFGTIHEVLIQNFSPEPGTKWEKKKGPTHQAMVAAVEMARNILPDDVPVSVPLDLNEDITDFIKAGVRDLGRIYEGENGLYSSSQPVNFEKLSETLGNLGFRLQQRFPIRKEFIKEGLYSKKLGQVFDSYRYRIKKEGQEKIREAKVSQHGA